MFAFWAFIWFLSAVTGMVFIIKAIVGNLEAKKIAQKADFLMQDIDQKYEDFMQKFFNLANLKPDKAPLSGETIAQKAFIILKPEIDGLISFINASNQGNIPIQSHTKYFKGIASLVQAYFRKTAQSGAQLSEHDEEKFYTAFKDALIAHINQKMLDLNLD